MSESSTTTAINEPAVRDAFASRYGRSCQVVARAPGRVNLIGEHTDYNDGFVLPIAIEQSTWIACAPREDQIVQATSLELNETQQWPLDGWTRAAFPHWTSYIAGVAALLRRRSAHLGGFDLLVTSEVPPGGGLASSAALEVACVNALAYLSGEPLMRNELIDLCRQAEHEFAGVPCGLMDQSASLLAQAGHALLLDCRSREAEQIPCPLEGHCVLVIDSGVRHQLVSSEYARRQQECQEAVAYFRRADPQVRALRDVASQTVRSHASQMPPLAAARALHVASENERTRAAAKALRAGKLEEFGGLMNESHRSLRDDYEVSCKELDQLVDILRGVRGVLGARMTGGGFGGCVVALARTDAMEPATHAIQTKYDPGKATPARILPVRPGPGAELVYTA